MVQATVLFAVASILVVAGGAMIAVNVIVGCLVIVVGLVVLLIGVRVKQGKQKDFSIYWLDDASAYETDDEDFEIMENDSTKSVITGFIKINTMNKITVESIELNIEDYPPVKPVKEWMVRTFYGSELPIECKFDIPPNIPRGKRITKISAIVDNERYINDPFILNLPSASLFMTLGYLPSEPIKRTPEDIVG